MTVMRSACPLNCPDSCSFLVENTEQGLQVRGDYNEVTQGFVCSKGQALAARVFAPERLRFPLLRQGEGWKRLTWDEAYSVLAEKLQQTLAASGPWGIYHHYDYGHNGILRNLDRRFFQALGGVTEPRGSLCWGSGYRAQELDFGAVYSSDWDDLCSAQTIILWGRDPAVTNLHLVPSLLRAKKRGAHIVVINPVKVKSAEFAQEYVRVNPGSDAALALGLCYVILHERWLDWDFVRNHVHGFDQFALQAKEFPPERVAALTGVPESTLYNLARIIVQARPVAFFVGYGLQRHSGGGNTIRAIDALAAISGNIGRSGAGVHYAHQYHRGKLNSLELPAQRYQARTYPHPVLAEKLIKADPAINLAVVTRSNPLVQQPNSLLWRELWQQIPFKVVLDTCMTETARQSDLVLPITTIFEEEDLIATSWSPLLQYAQKVVEPQGEAKPEPELFTELAGLMGLEQEFARSPREWLAYALAPLAEEGISLETLKAGPLRAPYIPRVAWEHKRFLTPSGKIELFSERAEGEGKQGVATYVATKQEQYESGEYPLYLLTPHPARGLHSQFQTDEGFKVYIHPDLAERHYLLPGDRAQVETEAGQLVAQVQVTEDIHPQAVVIPEGTTDNGLGVNQLIVTTSPDYGEGVPYYDARCQIRKWMID